MRKVTPLTLTMRRVTPRIGEANGSQRAAAGLAGAWAWAGMAARASVSAAAASLMKRLVMATLPVGEGDGTVFVVQCPGRDGGAVGGRDLHQLPARGRGAGGAAGAAAARAWRRGLV